MANIVEKAFDASKNIVRTLFLGKPNLFTTSDLNRQIEAFKYQMNSIENRLGAEADMELSIEKVGPLVRCKVTKGTYFRVNGLNIPLPNFSENFDITADYGDEVYFYVWGNFVRKTYDNDPTHEISGAKFTDGTSMPSADQLVLGEVHYAMTDDIGDITRSDDDFAFLIAKAVLINLQEKTLRLNYKKEGQSVMTDATNFLEYVVQPEQEHEDDILNVGDDFNVCINKLISKDSLRKEDIKTLKKTKTAFEESIENPVELSSYYESTGPNMFKIYLEGRTLFFSMRAFSYKVGPFTSGSGESILTTPLPEALSYLSDFPNFECVIHRHPLWNYGDQALANELTNCYVDFVLKIEKPRGGSKKYIDLSVRLSGRYGQLFNTGQSIDLYNKDLFISTTDLVVKSVRLPSYIATVTW